MDPNAAWEEMCDPATEPDRRFELADALSDWIIVKRGSSPRGVGIDTCLEACDAVIDSNGVFVPS
jgi:hypothetical protein